MSTNKTEILIDKEVIKETICRMIDDCEIVGYSAIANKEEIEPTKDRWKQFKVSGYSVSLELKKKVPEIPKFSGGIVSKQSFFIDGDSAKEIVVPLEKVTTISIDGEELARILLKHGVV